MVMKKDPFWESVEALDGRFICKFCERNFAGGVPRIKSPLLGITGRDIDICTKVPEDIQAKAFLAVGGSKKKAKNKETTSNTQEHGNATNLSRVLQQSTVSGIFNKKDKDEVDKKLAKFFVLNNISFNVIQTPSFKEFFTSAIEYGKSYKIPSYSTLGAKLIPDLRKEVDEYVVVVKKSWALMGCTLMSDVRSDMKHRSFINIVAYSPGGAVMNSFEVSKEKKTSMYLRDILVSVIDDIGAENVVQFIIDNASNFESVGDMLMGRYPHLYKTRCAAHGIQLLLKDIYVEIEWVRKVIDVAKLIVMFMYKHIILLSLMREHTNNRELKHPCTTRFASNFKMVESVINVEDELRMFVTSSTWIVLDYTKKTMGKQVTKIIQDSEFWKQGKEVLQTLEPLVRVLRLVDGEGSTSGYLYEAERAKEAIKKNCHNNQSKYMHIWTLFEVRRSENIIHLIHVVAAFLNPAYIRSENFREDKEMKEGITYLLEHLVASEEKTAFLRDVQLYRMKVSSLFTNTAITM